MRVKMVVAYDGTNYSGWQLQKNAVTIEQKLNEALYDLLGEEIQVTGASRTDAGVHSLGNVCVFDTNTRMPAEKICYALNTRLPEDIVVQSSCQVADDFHPRFCDTIKTYEYKIWNSRFPNPMVRLYSKFVYYNIDIGKMQEAANYLIGEHDFKSFCSTRTQVENTVRHVTDISFEKEGNMITMRIKGYGFLYNMVRIISGTLVDVGLGKIKSEEIPEIINSKDRTRAGKTLPPYALYLVKVEY